MKILIFLSLFITTANSLTEEENAELRVIDSLLNATNILLNQNITLETIQPKGLAQILMKRGNLIFKSKNESEIIAEMDEDFIFKGCDGSLNREKVVKNAMKNEKHRDREVKNGRIDGSVIIGEVIFKANQNIVFPLEYHWRHLKNGKFVLFMTKVMKCDGFDRKILNDF